MPKQKERVWTIPVWLVQRWASVERSPPRPLARGRPSSSPPLTESTGEGPKVCKQRPCKTTLWWWRGTFDRQVNEISYLRLVANSRLDRIKKLRKSNVIFTALKYNVSQPVPNSPVYGTNRVWVLYCACHCLLYSWSSSSILSWMGQTFMQGFIKHLHDICCYLLFAWYTLLFDHNNAESVWSKL